MTDSSPRLLVVDDDSDIADSLKYFFERTGEFRVDTVADGRQAYDRALSHPPDLILLDLNLPGMDGAEVCRLLRQSPITAELPIVMLTARAAEQDRIDGLDLGADDYVAKPFSLKELLARVRAVLRRSGHDHPDEQLSTQHLRMEGASRRVFVGEEEIRLTRKEFDLLASLLRQRGRVLTRENLLERVWGYDHIGSSRTVDVHVRQLRKKLGSPAADAIETVVGVGYRMRVDS